MLATSLLARLTLAEKITLLHQAAPAVDRVGLGAFRTGTEALHGLSWLGTATVFPQPVGLAASWDPDLLRQVGDAVATEVRAKHAADPTVSLNVWAPVVNPLRHPLWGRTEEGYSEDPDLTAALAVGYATGLRGEDPLVWKTVPTLKHFLGYSNETDRAVTSSHLPPQALREYELPAFTGPLAAGVVGAVMPSYNLVNGRPNHVARELLTEMRSWAPASIAVVSDAQAPSNLVDDERYFADHVTSHAAALRAGIDSFTDNDTRSAPTVERLTAALEAGLVTESDIDTAVLRLLELRARTGELTDDDPYGIGTDAIDTPAHRALARATVARGVVVLANEGGALPLRDPATVAVVGPFADHVVHDWYSGTPPYLRTVAAALRERYPDADVRVCDGADRVALRSLTQDRYVTVDEDGRAVAALSTTAAPETLFDLTDWGEGLVTLRSVRTGRLLTGARWVLTADAERVGGWVVQESFRPHRHDDGSVSFEHVGSGRWLRVQHGSHLLVAEGGAATAERFAVRTVRSGLAAVAEACAGAEVAVVAVGNEPHLLGRETQDRPHLRLPDSSREVWRTAVEHADAAVLTVVSSYPYAVGDEAASAAAVVWTSHGGQELGTGLVDVLSGDVEPSGRLAQTWWRTEADAGDLLEYDVVGAAMTYRYATARPLYGLGHGLGYSTVVHESLHLSTASVPAPSPTLEHTPARATAGEHPDGPGAGRPSTTDDGHTVTAVVRVRNTGDRGAHELVAVWALAPELPVPAPRVRLAGWTRVALAPGEVRDVDVEIGVGVLAVWDVAADAGAWAAATPGAFRVQGGSYRLATGPSAAHLTVGADLEVAAAEPALRRPDLLEAHAFHAVHGLVTSDRARDLGSCVEVHAAGQEGWARYDRLDLHDVVAVQLDLARRDLPGRGPSGVRVEVRAVGDDGPWVPLGAEVPVAAGGSRYDWQRVDVPLTGPGRGALRDAAAVDLRIVLRGATRLAAITLVR